MLSFDAANKFYKNITGAVGTDSTLRLSVVLPRSTGVTACKLIINSEPCGKETVYMDWASTDGIGEIWTREITFSRVGVYFYHFEYDTPFGTMLLKREGISQKGSLKGENEWQQTVYPKNKKTPDGIKRGIIYQIFPDRFNFSGEEKKNVPTDRILRADRENLPYFEPDKDGKIRNNDYFCGDFKGIENKLDYIASLGTEIIYLNPICEAQSNHRYDTSDYMKPDSLLGSEEDFISLVNAVHKRGMRLILDGVFSHTGADSVYFNKNGRYDSVGAYGNENSPYRKWYTFDDSEVGYECWWGVAILPEVRENDSSFTEFITGEKGVLAHWLSLGADGFRFDVADELPDEFTDKAISRIKSYNNENYCLGEVWEDATNKISYGRLRKYLLGEQYDGVMNYPFRKAIIDFLLTSNAESFMDSVYSVVLNYPPYALNCCMNMLGTHDTARILTVLTGIDIDKMSRREQSGVIINDYQRSRAEKLIKSAVAILYTLPGIPCVYYGDEAGMYGGKDPFNRCCYPWEKENKELLDYYRLFGKIRRQYNVLFDGGFYPLSAEAGCVAYLRYSEGKSRVALIANNNPHGITYNLNYDMRDMLCITGGEKLDGAVYVPDNSAVILADNGLL